MSNINNIIRENLMKNIVKLKGYIFQLSRRWRYFKGTCLGHKMISVKNCIGIRPPGSSKLILEIPTYRASTPTLKPIEKNFASIIYLRYYFLISKIFF